MEDENPFVLNAYSGPAYFCNRITETEQIKQYIRNKVNITLFAVRRSGKTGLIHHVFNSLESNKRIACIYIDILPTQNLKAFTDQLATAIYNRFPPQKTIGKKIAEFIKFLKPTINFDELSGIPSISLSAATPTQQVKTIQQLFSFLDQQAYKVVFAIDEFQQVLEYPEKNTEAILRTHIQQLKNTHFIFCGSNQKLMHEIFNTAKRPFFASCSAMTLDFIKQKDYRDFIKLQFSLRKRSISEECISFICEWTKLHTYYTQYFCNALFALNHKKNELANAKQIAVNILSINENTFFQYRNLLTTAQWNLLKAIAMEEQVFKPNAAEFISGYGLGTPSLITRGLASLLEKEMIFYNSGAEKPYYEVYDKFLMRWLQRY